MTRHRAWGLLTGILSTMASAQTPAPPPSLLTRVAAAESVFRLEDTDLRGPGVETLAMAVDRARYVLVGEAHLSREIPRLTVALCRLMAPHGLRAIAVETGPEAARIVNADLRRADRVARLSAFMRAHPDAMAFQNVADEGDMAAACARIAGPGFELWGLDQEFFGASGFLLDGMAASSPGPIARAAITRLIALDRTATAAAIASRSPAKFLIYTVTDRQMDEARAAIARDGGARARQLFEALAETRAIFLASASGDGDPNGRRARLIKRTLAGYLATAPTGSRVLMKFGDVHMAKGVNGLRQRDLGNFVAERAEGEGAESLHILAMGAEGSLSGYNGVGQQVAVRPYAPGSDSDYPWLKDMLAARPEAATAADWLLVDLRRLRDRPTKDMPAAWRQLVQAYDLVVIAPRLTPAFLVGAGAK
jgi:erythromycin esterase-like protein